MGKHTKAGTHTERERAGGSGTSKAARTIRGKRLQITSGHINMTAHD